MPARTFRRGRPRRVAATGSGLIAGVPVAGDPYRGERCRRRTSFVILALDSFRDVPGRPLPAGIVADDDTRIPHPGPPHRMSVPRRLSVPQRLGMPRRLGPPRRLPARPMRLLAHTSPSAAVMRMNVH